MTRMFPPWMIRVPRDPVDGDHAIACVGQGSPARGAVTGSAAAERPRLDERVRRSELAAEVGHLDFDVLRVHRPLEQVLDGDALVGAQRPAFGVGRPENLLCLLCEAECLRHGTMAFLVAPVVPTLEVSPCPDGCAPRCAAGHTRRKVDLGPHSIRFVALARSAGPRADLHSSGDEPPL
jgi:hypothetical protein